MRRAGEAQHLCHVAHVVAGVLGQLGGRQHPHEIDHAFQRGRPAHGEAARQMLTGYAELSGQLVGSHGPARATYDALPHRDLQRRLEMQNRRRLRQRALETTGEGAAQHEFARHAVVDSFHQHVGNAGVGRPRDEWRVGG